MHFLFPVLSSQADDLNALGRVDPSTRAQDTMMELLVEGFPNKAELQDENGHFRDVKDWGGVQSNSKKDIIKISWSYGHTAFAPQGGTIAMQRLPRSLLNFAASGDGLMGIIDLSAAPPTLRHLMLGNNALSGSLLLDSLPSELRSLSERLSTYWEHV